MRDNFFSYTSDLEKYWRESLPKYEKQELLIIFHGAKELISSKIAESEKIIKELELEISKVVTEIEEMDTNNFSKWFAIEIVKMNLMPNLFKYDNELFCLKRYMPARSSANKYISNFENKLEIARYQSIYEVISQYVELKQVGNSIKGLCPFHEEKSASFFVYEQQGKYHCYGCQAHGDVIKFIQEIQGVEFKNAVEFLQK